MHDQRKRVNFIKAAAFCASTLLLTCFGARMVVAQQAEPNRITGTVVNTQGEFVENAQISFKETSSDNVRHAESDERGSFQLTSLPTGTYSVNEPKKAQVEYERAIQINPDLPLVHALYAQVLLKTGETDRALEEYKTELRLDPNSYEANLYIGYLLKEKKSYSEALAYLNRALQLRPGSIEARCEIANLFVLVNKLNDALPLLEKIVREVPDLQSARVSLATVYYKLKRKSDGDREAEVIKKLNLEAQMREQSSEERPSHAGSKEIQLGKRTEKIQP